MANGASVTDLEQVEAMVAEAKADWGGVHILINNAGILRDKSFAKMDMADFRAVVDVHLIGSANCTQRGLGDDARAELRPRADDRRARPASTAISARPITAPPSSAWSASPKTLAIEGARDNIKVNTIAPTAATRMTEELFPPEMLGLFRPELVAPAALFLVSRGRADRRDPRRRRRRRPGRLCDADQRR